MFHCFDLSTANSLVQLEEYLQLIPPAHYDQMYDSILLGLRMDLPRQITPEQVHEFMQKHSHWMWNYWEVSSISGQNIDNLYNMFERKVAKAYEKRLRIMHPPKPMEPKSTTNSSSTCGIM